MQRIPFVRRQACPHVLVYRRSLESDRLRRGEILRDRDLERRGDRDLREETREGSG